METPRLIPADWSKRNNINFLRLALALLVIYFHTFAFGHANLDSEPFIRFFQGTYSATIGTFSVMGFFALSGLLISQSWLAQPQIGVYFSRRLLRIWPGFFVASLVTLFFFVPLGTDDRSGFLSSLHSGRLLGVYLLRAVCLQMPEYPFGFEHNPVPCPFGINGSLWTIIYEFSWYGIVAVLGVLGLLKRRGFILALAGGMLFANWEVQQHFPLFGGPQLAGMALAWWTIYGTAFVAGMAALAFRERIPRHPLLAVLAILSFIPAHFYPPLLLILIPTSFVYLLFYIAFAEKLKLQAFGSKVDLSYGVYLYACPVEQWLISWRPAVWGSISLTLATTVLTLPFALMSWHLVERPAKNLYKRKLAALISSQNQTGAPCAARIWSWMSRSAEVGVGLLLSLLAISAHAYYAFQAGGLWRDEVSSVELSRMPWRVFWQQIGNDRHPFIYNFLLSFWMRLGLDSDAGFRALGFITGVAVLAWLWWAARRLRLGVPLLGLTMVALNPVWIRWGDSIRPYGMGVLLSLLLFWLMWSVLRAPQTWRVVIALIVAVVTVQTTYQACGTVFATTLAAAIVAGIRRRWSVVVICLGIGAAGALSLLLDLGQLSRVANWQPIMTSMESGLGITSALGETLASGSSAGMIGFWIILPLMGVAIALRSLVRPARATAPHEERDTFAQERTLYCLGVVLLGVPVMFLVLLVGKSVVYPWHFLLPLALLAVTLDGLVAMAIKTNENIARAVRVTFALTLAIFMAPGLFTTLTPRQTNVNIIADLLEKNAQPADLIVVAPWYMGVSFHYYYHGATPWITLPNIEDHLIHRFDLVKEQMVSPTTIPPALERIRQTLRAGGHIWIVGPITLLPDGEMPAALPPPPHPVWGWSAEFYTKVWETQAMQVMRSAAATAHNIDLPLSAKAQIYEDLPLILVQGRAGP